MSPRHMTTCKQCTTIHVKNALSTEGLQTTDGRVHVTLQPDAVLDTASQQWSVVLTCGHFTFTGQPPFPVEWVVSILSTCLLDFSVSACLPVCLSVSVSVSVPVSAYLPACLSVCLSLSLSVCLSVSISSPSLSLSLARSPPPPPPPSTPLSPKLRTWKPTHTLALHGANVRQPWWTNETQAAWTDKQTMVRSCRIREANSTHSRHSTRSDGGNGGNIQEGVQCENNNNKKQNNNNHNNKTTNKQKQAKTQTTITTIPQQQQTVENVLRHCQQ